MLAGFGLLGRCFAFRVAGEMLVLVLMWVEREVEEMVRRGVG